MNYLYLGAAGWMTVVGLVMLAGRERRWRGTGIALAGIGLASALLVLRTMGQLG